MPAQHVVINIRGTSGSGKSHAVYSILGRHASEAIEDRNGKIEAYYVPDFDLYIIGRYTTPCGGCDTIPSMAQIALLVEKYSKRGNVLFEGLLLSSTLGVILRARKRSEAHWIWAFLNTPIAVCLKRISMRRAARNVDPSGFKAENTIRRGVSIKTTALKLKKMGEDVRSLDYRQPYEQIVKMLRGATDGTTQAAVGADQASD